MAENETLKQCSDKNGLTKWKTLMNGLNSPSHEPEEAPKGDGAIDDVTSTIKHAKQTNTRISGNLKHQRNLQVSQASSMMAAQAAAMGLPTESATAIGNFAASTVAKSLSFAQAAAVPRYKTSMSNSEQFPPLP